MYKLDFIMSLEQVTNLPIKVRWLYDIVSKKIHIFLIFLAWFLFPFIYSSIALVYMPPNNSFFILMLFIFIVYMAVIVIIIFHLLKIIENKCYKYILSNQINIYYTINERFVYSNVDILLDLTNNIIKISTSNKDNEINIKLANTLHEILKDILSLKSA
jgi:hypothetical protein